MNKRAEISITLGIVVAFIFLGLSTLIADEKFTNQDMRFMGDKSTKIVYDLQSDSPNCAIDNIEINNKNIIHFSDIDSALNKGYKLDLECN